MPPFDAAQLRAEFVAQTRSKDATRQHAGVLGLAALMASEPYNVPTWLLDVAQAVSSRVCRDMARRAVQELPSTSSASPPAAPRARPSSLLPTSSSFRVRQLCEGNRSVGDSAFNAVALVPVLDGHDQIPLLVHRDRVGEQRVEDVDAEESGQVKVGEADEDVGGALADAVERGPGRGGEQLGQLGARVVEADVHRERIAAELREQLSVGDETNGNSSRKSRSSPANDPTRAAATRAGCCGAVRCVSCAKQSARRRTKSRVSDDSCPSSAGTEVSALFSNCGER